MNFLTGSLLLVLAVGVAQGLKCYTCEGASSFVEKGNCGDTYEPVAEHIKTCNASAGEMYCSKTKYGIKAVITNVERGCLSECDEHNIAYAHRNFCCQHDLCNYAPHTAAASVIVIIAAALIGKLF